MKHSRSFLLGLILGLSIATASAATLQLTIPDAVLPRVIDAWSIGRGWTPASPLSKAAYARQQMRHDIVRQVVVYESRAAEIGAAQGAEGDLSGVGVN